MDKNHRLSVHRLIRTTFSSKRAEHAQIFSERFIILWKNLHFWTFLNLRGHPRQSDWPTIGQNVQWIRRQQSGRWIGTKRRQVIKVPIASIDGFSLVTTAGKRVTSKGESHTTHNWLAKPPRASEDRIFWCCRHHWPLPLSRPINPPFSCFYRT